MFVTRSTRAASHSYAAPQQTGQNVSNTPTATKSCPLSPQVSGKFVGSFIVAGPARGTVWFDRRAACDDIVPFRDAAGNRASFATFYLDWLAAAEAGVPAPIWEDRHRIAH
jgi:hypothetical protein